MRSVRRHSLIALCRRCSAASMSIRVRKSKDRGHADLGWLDSYHTFSFASYHDPHNSGFAKLRVLNEDRVKGGKGFGEHPHSDYEIFSYVVRGALRHRDSLGNEEIIGRGGVQFTSAGTGIFHAEHNASSSDPVHFLQLWVKPWKQGLPPSYSTKFFPDDKKRNKLVCFIAKKGSDEASSSAIAINQDFLGHAALLEAGASVTYKPADEYRRLYLHVVDEGGVAVKVSVGANEAVLSSGDGAFIEGAKTVEITRLAAAAGAQSSVAEFVLLDSV